MKDITFEQKFLKPSQFLHVLVPVKVKKISRGQCGCSKDFSVHFPLRDITENKQRVAFNGND